MGGTLCGRHIWTLGSLRPSVPVPELRICLREWTVKEEQEYLGLSAGSGGSRVQREVMNFSLLFSKIHKYLETRVGEQE